MIFGNTFYEIAAILGLAAVIGAIGQKLRQPLIIMFLATGIVAGPACLGVIESHQQIELLAQIGIALLLFIVGLRLDLDLIRTTGVVALATGLGNERARLIRRADIMRAVTVRADRRVQVPSRRRLRVHTVHRLFVVDGVALFTGLVIGA